MTTGSVTASTTYVTSSISGTISPFVTTLTSTTAGTTGIYERLQFNYTSGAAVNIALRIVQPVLVKGRACPRSSLGPAVAVVVQSPLANATIAALKAVVSTTQQSILTTDAASPFPSPTCSATPDSTCTWGMAAQALRLLALGGTTNIANANTLLSSYVSTAPTVSGFGTNSSNDFFFFNPAQLIFRAYMQFRASLTTAVQNQIVGLFWAWGQGMCTTALANSTAPNIYLGSENIGSMMDSACYAAAYLAANSSYASSTFNDGTTPAAMLALYTTRIRNWLQMQGTHGIWIEAWAAYNAYTMTAVLQAYDVMPDTIANRLAQGVLDLYWSAWAERQVGGNVGDGRVRNYITNSVVGEPAIGPYSFYFGQGTTPAGVNAPSHLSMLVSSYVPPDVAYDIALDVTGRGSYETQARELAYQTRPEDANGYFYQSLSATDPGVHHYTYVTPNFAMGSLSAPLMAYGTWSAVASQNWWHGVVFSGSVYGTNKVACEASNTATGGEGTGNPITNAATYAVQSKATMLCLTQLNTAYSAYANHASVWIGNTMTMTEDDSVGHSSWVWVNGTTAYAAVLVPGGTYSWGTPGSAVPNALELMPANSAPVLIQAGSATDFASFAAFQAAVRAMAISINTSANTITVASGLYGASTLVANYSTYDRSIGGQAVVYNPSWAWNSPFISSAGWGATSVTISKGGRTDALDFSW